MHDRREWLRQLRPAPDQPIPEAVSRPGAVAAVVEAIGKGPVEWARRTGFDMASRIGDEIGDFSHSGDVFALLRMGTESCVLQALTYLQLSADEDAVPDPGAAITPEASLGAVEFAQRGISLDAVLRGIRLGHAELQDALYSILRQVVKTDDLAIEMQRLAELLFVFVDAWSSDMVRDYTAEHQRYSVSRAASRVAAIRAVLDGSLTDAATASAQLGYDLTRAHVAIIVWRPSDQSGPSLESQAAEVLESLGATKTLIAAVGISSVWGWGSRTSFSSAGKVTLPSPSSGTHITIGEPAVGITGFRSAHEQAAAARKLSLVAPPTRASPSCVTPMLRSRACFPPTWNAPGKSPSESWESLPTTPCVMANCVRRCCVICVRATVPRRRRKSCSFPEIRCPTGCVRQRTPSVKNWRSGPTRYSQP